MGNIPSLAAVSNLHGSIDRHGGCSSPVTADECAWAHRWWTNWYNADLAYGRPIIYLFCATIGLFTAVNLVHRFRQTRVGSLMLGNIPAYKTLAAFFRGVGGRQYRLGSGLTFLPLGTTLLIAGLVTISAALCLGPKPYYWPSLIYGNSPPLATRAGWLSIAILPFQVLFASKWNLITMLTGVSHEKLQPYHRWTGWIMYILALIHTFPFIVVDFKYGTMHSRWHGSYEYWSGVAALVPNTFLVTMSIGVIRNKYYETFKSLHILVASFFLVMLFLHCDFTETSADYFIGLAAVYIFSLAMRWGKSFKHGFHHRASVELLEDRMLKITIPSHVTWAPGQHFFFSFMIGGIQSLTSHPFTVASIASSGQIVVYARVGGGITARLANPGEKDVRVLLDGPYGGIGGDLRMYDRVLLVGGGSGGAFILAVLRHLAELGESSPCKSISVVYATRSPESLGWFKQTFEEVLSTASEHLEIDIKIHVTSASAPTPAAIAPEASPKSHSSSSSDDDLGAEKGKRTVPSIAVLAGRPDLSEVVALEIKSGVGTIGVGVCGPAGLTVDMRNYVAKGQLEILKGSSSLRECFLHTEEFGW